MAEKAPSPDPEKAARTQTTTVMYSKKIHFYLQSKQSSNKRVLTSEGGKGNITNIKNLTVITQLTVCR